MENNLMVIRVSTAGIKIEQLPTPGGIKAIIIHVEEPDTNPPAPLCYVRALATSINVRVLPDISSRHVGRLVPGDEAPVYEVAITGKGDEWVRLSPPGADPRWAARIWRGTPLLKTIPLPPSP